MSSSRVNEIFRRLSNKNPTPQTELEYANPYTLLVAVVLSAQATDVGVNKATPALFAIADTTEKMLRLGERRLRSYIKTIGLYNTKAKNIIKLSRMLVDEYDGQVPDTRERLEALPGVGRKTANVVVLVKVVQKSRGIGDDLVPATVFVDQFLEAVRNRYRKVVRHYTCLHYEHSLL